MSDLPDGEGIAASEPTPPRRRSLTLGCLLIGLAAVLVMGVVTFPFFTTLMTILMPPPPPLPAVPMTEISHQNYDYGVDEWEYLTALPACELVAYYQSIGTCAISPFECSSDGQYDPSNSLVARCSGSQAAGQFGMTWDVRINRENDTPENGRIRIYRAINWLSSTPPPNH